MDQGGTRLWLIERGTTHPIKEPAQLEPQRRVIDRAAHLDRARGDAGWRGGARHRLRRGPVAVRRWVRHAITVGCNVDLPLCRGLALGVASWREG